jgi:hypothetical protein
MIATATVLCLHMDGPAEPQLSRTVSQNACSRVLEQQWLGGLAPSGVYTGYLQ